MGNFGRDSRGRSGGGRSFGGDRGRSGGGRSFGGDRGRGRSFGRDGTTEMFDATCDKCGKRCQVPFRPTGSKPVLCDNCFDAKKHGSSAGGVSSEQFDQINAKLDKILQVLSELEIDYDDSEEDLSDEESDDSDEESEEEEER